MAKDDFPAISDGEARPEGDSSRDAKPGATWEETVYEDIGGDWKNGEWGDEIGTVRLEQSDGEVTASFTFREAPGGRKVKYRGPVPGGGSWRGKSTLRHVDGDDRGRPNLEVESTNPKRWG
jgi:hypothetical protein